MMKVTLKCGLEIEIEGPVRKISADGKIFVSHTEFNFTLNGESGVIDIDILEGAEFPQEATQKADNAFDNALPSVLKAWNNLRNSVLNK